MPEPVLVPPTPTINQSDSPEQIAHTLENVQKIFDRVSPKVRGTPTPEPPVAPAPHQPVEAPTAPVEAPKQQQAPPPESPDTVTDPHKVPSFIEKALEGETVKTETPPATAPAATAEVDADWPDELPQEQKQSRVKNLRDAYKALKQEVQTLKSRPASDPILNEKLTLLETRNKEMETQLSRFGVEQHAEFQNKILRPMTGAWNEAARIVKETGGDPQELAKALALTGKAQYEALDSVFEGMPDSAKIRVNNAIAVYQNLDAQRRAAIADAPKTAKALQEADIKRQYESIAKQKQEMETMFDNAVAKLRDKAKVEVLQKSSDPDAKWWNEQADEVVATSRKLFLDNTDMEKVAMACALAPMVDTYRKMWMVANKKVAQLNKIISDRFGSEPNLSTSGGNINGSSTPQEDLKKPFDQVFLREFHKQRNSGAR